MGGVTIPIYTALLRGINVSGHNLIKMSDLKQMFQVIGFGQVQTYIQSGNVLFQSDEPAASLRGRIEHAIKATFGLDLPVILRTLPELEQIVARCPFPADALAEGESLHVSFLAEPPPADGLARLSAVPSGIDEYRLVGTEIYILYRQPSHKSKLGGSLFEQKLRVPATARNWATVTKLVAMAKAFT